MSLITRPFCHAAEFIAATDNSILRWVIGTLFSNLCADILRFQQHLFPTLFRPLFVFIGKRSEKGFDGFAGIVWYRLIMHQHVWLSIRQ
jgi:hypothetical protein